MKKQYKDISEFTVKKSKVVILGISFMLSSVVAEAVPSHPEEGADCVEIVEDAAVVAPYGTGDFELAEAKDKWQLILDDLSEYPDNWDAEGARGISQATIDNCRLILKDSSNYITLLDDIFPTAFGTVCIQWYKPSTDALVNAEIAPDRMAFYAHEPGKDIFDFRPAPFGKDTIEVLVSILESLS